MAYPDAVALLITHLKTLHSTLTVASRIPNPRPTGEFIQVRRVGGARLIPVRDAPRLDVFCWSTSEPAAEALGKTVRAEIGALEGASLSGVQCYRVDEFSYRQWDDPLAPGNYATWGTYTLTLRADDAI